MLSTIRVMYLLKSCIRKHETDDKDEPPPLEDAKGLDEESVYEVSGLIEQGRV